SILGEKSAKAQHQNVCESESGVEPGGQESVDCLLPCLFSQPPVVSSHVAEDEGGDQPREAGALGVSQRAFGWWAVATGGPHHPAAETTASCHIDAFRGVDNSS
ncbi:hypothetical protein EK904_007986, partial [Melospiza melodia maxima]